MNVERPECGTGCASGPLKLGHAVVDLNVVSKQIQPRLPSSKERGYLRVGASVLGPMSVKQEKRPGTNLMPSSAGYSQCCVYQTCHSYSYRRHSYVLSGNMKMSEN